ncbi:MAG: hypothetical protein WAX69_05150 [Victivallales bacterium]
MKFIVGALIAGSIGFSFLATKSVVADTLKSEDIETIDACESFNINDWWLGGTKISVETSPELVKEGKGSLKIVYPVDQNHETGWLAVTKHSLKMKKPKEIIFWVKPDAPYISPQIIDSDGTQVGTDIDNLKIGEWNIVCVRVEDMGMINKGKDGVLSDLDKLTFAVHPHKSGFKESKDYIYYFDNITMIPAEEKTLK